MRRYDNARRWCFALVDLIALTAIGATLAGFCVPVFLTVQEDSARAACAKQLVQISKALELYCGDYGQYFPSHPAWGSKSVCGSVPNKKTCSAYAWHLLDMAAGVDVGVDE